MTEGAEDGCFLPMEGRSGSGQIQNFRRTGVGWMEEKHPHHPKEENRPNQDLSAEPDQESIFPWPSSVS